LVYGDNWTGNQILEISDIFYLNKFTNYSLAGDSTLISKLLEFYKPKNQEIEKRRILYKTDNIIKFNTHDLKIRRGSFDQLNELAKMLQDYYREEYNGLNDKTIDDMEQRITKVIQTQKIYVLLDVNETILSFCTIIDPDIGIMFTKAEHRNKGYGKIILSHCSTLLQQKNPIVYVMTDSDKPESNIVCEKVGFRPYYYYLMTKINCG
jgi:hypothetical protein